MGKLLTTEQVAERLGWARNTLEKQRCAGGAIPYVKLGRSVRYREEDLEEWLAARVVSSTSESVPA
jgi:excisionase family DNA binding protein